MVMEEGKGTVWMNGKKTGTFKPTKVIAPHFSIAVSEEGKEAFYGEIYEVRYSTFSTGKFNPESDFLLDYKKIKESGNQRLVERRALVRELEQESVGKKIVTELPDVRQERDWLISRVEEPACLFVQKSENGLTSKFQLNNGLVSRTFYVGENIACVGYKNHSNEAEFLRAVKPEARVCMV